MKILKKPTENVENRISSLEGETNGKQSQENKNFEKLRSRVEDTTKSNNVKVFNKANGKCL